MELNTQQRAVVESGAECTLVIAGPGAGKTHVLIERILHSIKNDLDGADSLAGFEDVSEANAKRLLRNKAGLLRALGEVKAGMEAK